MMADVPMDRAAGERPRRLSRVAWLIVLVACAGIAGAAFYRFDPFGRKVAAVAAAPPPVAVTLAAVDHAEIQDQLTFAASVTALRRITISPYTSGHITDILVLEGAEVTAGQPLYRLDDRTAQAELALAQERVDLNRAKVQRDSTLQSEGFLAQVSLGATQADLAESEVDLQLKQLNLDLLTIRAPFAGRLERHQVALGQYVTPGTAMVDLVDPDDLAADIQVPERLLEQVRQGASVTFQSNASGQTFDGDVIFISAVIDPSTRTFAVRTSLKDPEKQLRPGLFGSLRLATGARRSTLVVPEEALMQQLTGASVYRVADGKAHLVQVQTGTTAAAGVEITHGLEAGDQVVTSGQFRLRDGDAVQPQPAAGS
ncbi:efflux RND transporter periplasmic adaptor subunit [Geminicoccus roseus]|uniref:efflux RND transporter periplasmic adaptor subunit n=1 Tax=Geminicoccus roseus TaxID=404900 RepID=UPI0003F627F8|nr:efflux RND transporter periplasmic adaptor subunit [Geminicoccus roseus]